MLPETRRRLRATRLRSRFNIRKKISAVTAATRRMNKTRQLRHNPKHNLECRNIVKAVLVPARQFPPAVCKLANIMEHLPLQHRVHMKDLRVAVSNGAESAYRAVDGCWIAHSKAAMILKLYAVISCFDKVGVPIGISL